MILPLKTIFPTFVTIFVFVFAVDIQTANGSSNTSTGANNNPNATLPEIDQSYENGIEDTNTNANTKTQNCQMPPCPPGEMCIQVCPETLPK